MKTILISLLLILPFLSMGQTNATLDFIAGIEHSFRLLIDNSDSGATINPISDLRGQEKGKFNYRFGVNYNKRISNKIWLKTGIRFASIGYKEGKLSGLRYGSEFDPQSGEWIPDPSLPHEIQIYRDYLFLEIPILIRNEFGTKKLTPFIECGFSTNIYLTSIIKQITDLDTSRTFSRNKSDEFNTLNFSSSFSFGANYSIQEKYIFYIQPIFRFHISKTLKAPISEHLYNVGLEFGLRKKLN